MFSLESFRFFESCSVAGATQCQGNTGICFHQRGAFPAKLAAARGEALTGKHFHSFCARRGVLPQWLSDRIGTFTFWSFCISFLPCVVLLLFGWFVLFWVFLGFFLCLFPFHLLPLPPPPLPVFRQHLSFWIYGYVLHGVLHKLSKHIFFNYQDTGWQWTHVSLRICTLQGQNSQGEKNKYCVTLSFPAQQSWSFLQSSSCFPQPFWGSPPQPAPSSGRFWRKFISSFHPASSLCISWVYHLAGSLPVSWSTVVHPSQRERDSLRLSIRFNNPGGAQPKIRVKGEADGWHRDSVCTSASGPGVGGMFPTHVRK